MSLQKRRSALKPCRQCVCAWKASRDLRTPLRPANPRKKVRADWEPQEVPFWHY